MSNVPNVIFIAGEVRLGGVSFQVGVARDLNGKAYVTGGFGGPVAMIDAGPVEATTTAMMSAALVAIFSYKATINVGGSWQRIEDFVDMSKPSVTWSVHKVVGIQGDISGDSYAFTFGPGTVLPGLQVNVQHGVSIGYLPTFSDTVYTTLYTMLRAGGLTHDTAMDTLGIPRCFLAGTPILMNSGKNEPIENVKVGDIVMSFSPFEKAAVGGLVPRRVSRTFQNETQHIISLKDLYCTPGHNFLTCDSEKYEDDRFETILSILKKDGVIIRSDGSKIRARNGATLNSVEDLPVVVTYKCPIANTERSIYVRAGIVVVCDVEFSGPGKINRKYYSLLQWCSRRGIEIRSNGLFQSQGGEIFSRIDWPEGSTPFDTIETQNWVVTTPDGKPYTPPWIADLVEEDENANLRVVGEMPSASVSGLHPSIRTS